MFPRAPEDLPLLTAAQMAEMDRHLVEEVGLPLLAMMENAGRHLAQAARQLHPEAGTVAVLAGKGGNGGGGLAAGRHLANAGLTVSAHLASPPDELTEAAAVQHRVLDAAGIPVTVGQPPPQPPDVVLDALLGYSQTGTPRGSVAELATWAQDAQAPTVSLDVPTGLDPDTGALATPRVTPAATVTLALPKRGLLEAPEDAVGRLLLADIGIPQAAYDRYQAPSPVFRNGPILQL